MSSCNPVPNSKQLTAGLLRHLGWGRRSLCLPRYTPANWWECDLAEITKSGYLVEYEIKISRSDFLADAKKARPVRDSVHVDTIEPVEQLRRGRLQPHYKKHDLLAAKHVTGPCRYWFVVPQGLLDLDEVPSWAGVIEALPVKGRHYFVNMRVARPAKQLHRQKADPTVEQHMRSVCYYRLLNTVLEAGRLYPSDS